jgi:phenylacetate-CoA ligase
MNAVNALARQSLLPTTVRVQRRVFSMLRPPSELLPELEQYQPQVISSYGSYLEALFTHVRGHGRTFRLARVATYGGDAFSAAARSWVKDELGIEVLGSYNAIEAPQIGFECEHHQGYHLNIDLCPVRLIGSDGHQVANEAEGEVVISNLVNRGTVLLNYRLGDLATQLTGPCRCRRTLPLCSYLGRTKAAWFDLGDGNAIHVQALRLVLRAERDIWRYQIVQEAERRFLVRVVARPRCDREATAERLTRRMCEQLPAGSAVRAEFVADLPRGASGKVQPVVGLDVR